MPWKLAKHVTQIPFKDRDIMDADAIKIVFPLMADDLDIYLKNHNENTIISYADSSLLNAVEKRAKEGDSIIISFTPHMCRNFRVDLVMEDIYSYSGCPFSLDSDLLRTRGIKYFFRSAKIAVTTGGETPSHIPPAKYQITIPWADLIFVNANRVYLSEAKYSNTLSMSSK